MVIMIFNDNNDNGDNDNDDYRMVMVKLIIMVVMMIAIINKTLIVCLDDSDDCIGKHDEVDNND